MAKTPPVPHITEQSRPSRRIGCLSPQSIERAAWQEVERLTRRRSEPRRLRRSDLVAIDAVDGSSTGTGVPWMWVSIRPHDSEEPSHASNYDHRSRHCEVCFPGSRRQYEGQCCASPPD